MQTLDEALRHLLQVPYLYYAITALVLLALLYLVAAIRRANRGIVPFKTEGGSIEISPSTLRSVMQHAAGSVEGVEKASCSHFLHDRCVGVRVAIHLRANSRLREVETSIKKCIRATLYEQFGMDNIEPIHIRVARMVGEPRPAGKDSYADELDEAQAGLLRADEDESDDRPNARKSRR